MIAHVIHPYKSSAHMYCYCHTVAYKKRKQSAQSDADYSGAPDQLQRNVNDTRCAAAVAEVSTAGRTDS